MSISLNIQTQILAVNDNLSQICPPLPSVCKYFSVSSAAAAQLLSPAPARANTFPVAESAIFTSLMGATVIGQLKATDSDTGGEYLYFTLLGSRA